MENKVLIIGDGILGSEIYNQTGWDIVSRKKTGFNISSFDLRDLLHYEIVINCIAHTDTYSNGKIKHFEVNYNFTKKLSDFCVNRNIKLVHISTEFVYANNLTPPTENDKPLPHNSWYAKTKLLADNYIELTNSSALICRLLHKPNNFDYQEVWDVKTSGDKVENIVPLILKLIQKQAVGIYNVGTGDKSLLELNPKAKLVQPPEYVPTDTRMNLDKLTNLLGN